MFPLGGPPAERHASSGGEGLRGLPAHHGGNSEAAMRSVDLHFASAGFGESLGDMRQWLDHNDCTPTIFRTKTALPGTVLTRWNSRKTTRPQHSSGASPSI